MSSSTSFYAAPPRKTDLVNYGLEPELIVEHAKEELVPLELMIKALVTELFKRKKE